MTASEHDDGQDSGLDDARGAIDRAQVGEPIDDGDGKGPEGCPVIPLGKNGKEFFYLTPLKQVLRMGPSEHRKQGITGLFEGDVRWLWKRFPATSRGGQDGEEPRVIGWNVDHAMQWLMNECRRCGVVDVSTQLRGLGAWPDEMEPDRLVFHAGDAVLIDGEKHPPGRHGKYIYAAGRPLDRPGETPLAPDQAHRLLKLLETWGWRHEEIMPRLLLGWIAVAGVPGALTWRPSIWISGDNQTGKSSLIDLLHKLMGSTVYHLANVSEPGIRQALRCDALSVMLDEFEATALQNVVADVLELVRIASSGYSGQLARGSASGTADFTRLTACFAFSSIIVPPLSPANQDRLTLFDLQPLDADHAEREVFLRESQAVSSFGPGLRRRVLDQWHRFRACLDAYGVALAAAGHKNRAADQLGTMLAGADLLLTDGVTTAKRAAEFAALLPAERLADEVDEMPTHARWLLDLMTHQSGTWNAGRREPIGQLIANVSQPGTWDVNAVAELRALGLRVVGSTEAESYGLNEPGLLIANRHTQLRKLFDGTDWAAVDWRPLLRRVPRSVATKPVPFGKAFKSRATLIPLSALPIDVQPGAGEVPAEF